MSVYIYIPVPMPHPSVSGAGFNELDVETLIAEHLQLVYAAKARSNNEGIQFDYVLMLLCRELFRVTLGECVVVGRHRNAF